MIQVFTFMPLCAHDCRIKVESGWSDPEAPASTHRKPIEPGHCRDDSGMEGPGIEKPGEMIEMRPAPEKISRE